MILKQQSLILHKRLLGKLSVISKIPLISKYNLTLVYTPGVAEISKQIYKNPNSIYHLTIKQNTVAVVTDGSAVLGLGNIGPEAALPVMEGKCAIFSQFAHLNAFPICLATQNVEEIINIIKNISPVFGAINLEDISAPRCFAIEKGLQSLGIPVVHDDQHATAIVVLAALYNAVKIVAKKLPECKIVVIGAGAAGSAITKLLHYIGVKNILVVDSQGIIAKQRNDLDNYKKDLMSITNPNSIYGTLQDAVYNADILIGVSTKGLFTKKIIHSLAKHPIILALANPDPEIKPENATKWGVKIFATGRSDYPNQVNNALVFPGFFKGLLDMRITEITNEMKVRAAKALSSLIKNPTPDKFIPSIFDKRVVPTIAASLQ